MEMNAELTLGQLSLTTGRLAQNGSAVTTLNNGRGVGEDGADSQYCPATGLALAPSPPYLAHHAPPSLPPSVVTLPPATSSRPLSPR